MDGPFSQDRPAGMTRNGRSRRGEAPCIREKAGRGGPRQTWTVPAELPSGQSAGAGLLRGRSRPMLAACSSGGDHHAQPAPRHSAGGRPNHRGLADFTDNQPIKAGRRRSRAHAEAKLVSPTSTRKGPEGLARSTTARSRVTTFNTMNEAMSKLRRGGELRRLLPTSTGWASWWRPAYPADQPPLIPKHLPGWPDLHQPILRRHSGGTRCRTRSTRRASPGERDRCREPYTMAKPWAMPGKAKYQNTVAILDGLR